MPGPKRLSDSATERHMFGRRVLLAVVVMVGLISVIVARYYQLQVVEHNTYRTQSERNRVHIEPVAPKRGLIYDRNGVLLASNEPSYSLTIVKEVVNDLDETLALLQQLVDVTDNDIEKFRQRMYRHRAFQAIPLKFRLSEEEMAIVAVNRHRLPGVEVQAQLVRYYPYGELLAHAVGYVGRINDKEQLLLDETNYAATHHVGKIGLEKAYEDILHGQVGYQYVETNARGKVLRVLERTDPVPGRDLHLSLDLATQKAAAEALVGERASVVAIEPDSGEILAIVSTPSFDPNLFVNGISSKDYAELRDSLDLPLFNRSLQGQYPPGSTIKPMWALGALHHEVITTETVVADPGWYQLPNDERFYRDWKRGGHAKWIDMHEAIVQSCDVFYYDMAYKMGIDRISEFAGHFGFGKPSGVDLTSERSGLMPDRQWKRVFKRLPWFPGETLNVGIGQGYMLATPIQLAQMTAMLATRGQLLRPRMVQAVSDQRLLPEVVDQLTVDAAHWQSVVAAMEDVITGRKGTAKIIAKGMQYRMAGKTGTAQVISIAQDERYDAEKIAKRKRDHALFVAFAPIDEPKIAVAVIVENGEHGSSTAAPIARKVIDTYLLPRLAADEAEPEPVRQ